MSWGTCGCGKPAITSTPVGNACRDCCVKSVGYANGGIAEEIEIAHDRAIVEEDKRVQAVKAIDIVNAGMQQVAEEIASLPADDTELPDGSGCKAGLITRRAGCSPEMVRLIDQVSLRRHANECEHRVRSASDMLLRVERGTSEHKIVVSVCPACKEDKRIVLLLSEGLAQCAKCSTKDKPQRWPIAPVHEARIVVTPDGKIPEPTPQAVLDAAELKKLRQSEAIALWHDDQMQKRVCSNKLCPVHDELVILWSERPNVRLEQKPTHVLCCCPVCDKQAWYPLYVRTNANVAVAPSYAYQRADTAFKP